MENKDKISVIVPIYNMEKYLGECIDSLINQTYDNIEIILVDDGSKDSSYEICKKYAQEHPNIVLVRKENGGCGSAKNAGIDAAKGDFFIIVDSDDWVAEDCCEQMMKLQRKYDVDLVHCEVFRDVKKRKRAELAQISFLNKTQLMEDFLNDRIRSGWPKLYRKSAVGSLRFLENNSIDDMVFITDLSKRLNNAVVSDMELYFYRYNRADSMSNSSKRRQRNLYERFEEFVNRYNVLTQTGYDGEMAFCKAVVHGLIFLDYLDGKDDLSEERLNVKLYLQNNRNKILKHKEIGLPYKLKTCILLGGLGLYNAITMFKNKIKRQ